MDTLFESLVGLVPIALIVALRIISARNKSAKAGSSAKDDRAAAIRKKIAEFSGASAGDKTNFFDEPFSANTDKNVEEKHYRGHWEEPVDERIVPAVQSEHVVPAATVSDFKSVKVSGVWLSDPDFRTSSRSYNPSAAGTGSSITQGSDNISQAQTEAPTLIKKVSALHPLQQAFVFTEILGTPKGLQ